MSDAINKLKQGQNLSFEESKSLFSDLMEGKHEENQIIEILEALIKKGDRKSTRLGKECKLLIKFLINFMPILVLMLSG